MSAQPAPTPTRPEPAPRRLLVLFNPRAGTAGGEAGAARLEEAMDRAGARGSVVRVGRRSAEELIREGDPDARHAVVAAGGDGTVRSVAQAVAGTARTLGVLPLGTRNHFARDAGIPLEPEAALDTLLRGREARVDVGEVEGRVFVNNASLGLYPRFVNERRRLSGQSGRRWAIVRSAWKVVRHPRRLRLRIDRAPAVTRASVVFVGNNPYHLAGLDAGSRETLDAGVLSLVVVSPTGPWHATRLALRTLLGRLEETEDFRCRSVRAFSIDVSRRRLSVALDGEPLRLSPPLHLRVRPGALRLLVPREED